MSIATLENTPQRILYAGHDPARAVTIGDLREMAHRRLPGFALEYLEGGAEEEATLERNRAALARWHFLPHALRDVLKRDTATTLFGRTLPLPFAIAPTGLNGLFWHEADRLLAEAAAHVGIPFAQSTMSNVALERIAQIPGLRHWYQLYVFGGRTVRSAIIDRARDAGCEALIVTTDAQMYGDREWERRWFTSPGHPTLRAIANAATHLRWASTTLLPRGMPQFENALDYVPSDRRGFFESAFWIRGEMDLALDWKTIEEIRARWPRKLLLKGLLRVDDVQRAKSVGADGVILSNHGGRQLDWAISGVDALREVREAVGDQYTVIVDGGMRRGIDVIKGIALGADAVLVGRATLYGVAAAGRAGAIRAIEILREEIDRDLALLGVPSVTELDRTILTRVAA